MNTQSTLYPLNTLLNQPFSDDSLVAFRSASAKENSASGNKNWQQFKQDIFSLQRYINQHNCQRWAICINDSYWFAVAFFALSYTKHHLILPGNHQPSALNELASQFDAIVVDKLISPPKSTVVLNIDDIVMDDHFDNMTQCEPQCAMWNTANTSITLYTSGSSGIPKAIEKTMAHFAAELVQLEQVWGKQIAGCRIHSTVSHQHIYGLLFRILWPLCTQRAFSRNNLEFPEQVSSLADENTVLISSPALLKRLDTSWLELNKHGLEPEITSYRKIFSSGGPLSHTAANQSLKTLGSLPVEVYGSTETGGIGYRQQRCENTLWRLFPNVKAKVNDQGCIALFAPHIHPEQWFQTADRCELTQNGLFALKGRADRVVKIEEKRVSLVNVEQTIEALEWISEAAVISIDTTQRTTLGAVITLSDKGEAYRESIGRGAFWIQLRKSLRQWLEPVAIPRQFRIVKQIPTNSQGKRLQFEITNLFSSPSPKYGNHRNDDTAKCNDSVMEQNSN